MRLLFIINGLRFGGMERQLVEVVKSLKNSGHSAYLVNLKSIDPFCKVVEPYLDSPIFYLDRRKSRFALTLFTLSRLVKDIKPDVVHVQDSFSAFYALPVVKLLGHKLVNGSIRHAGASHGWDYWFEKLLLLCSDTIISNSQAGLDFFRVKGYVVYNFIDRNRFTKATGPLSCIVINANFSAYKDQMTLVIAGKRLLREGKIEKIGLIGDGKYRKLCELIVKTWGLQNQLIFYGHISNVEETLCEYGIGVLCSTKRYKEGISNSILEYMGTGLIAIGSDVGATSEIIIDNVNGFLFETENPESLYEKISFVLNHPCDMEHIRQEAYRTLDKKFNAEMNCRKLIEIYNLHSRM